MLFQSPLLTLAHEHRDFCHVSRFFRHFVRGQARLRTRRTPLIPTSPATASNNVPGSGTSTVSEIETVTGTLACDWVSREFQVLIAMLPVNEPFTVCVGKPPVKKFVTIDPLLANPAAVVQNAGLPENPTLPLAVAKTKHSDDT